MPVHHVHIQRTQLVRAVRAVGGGHRIGDERRAVRREAEPEPDHRILDVEAVVDDLDGDAGVLHRRRDRARLAVVQAVHRVEHMRDDARAGVEAALGHVIVGVAVADRGHDARGREPPDGVNAMRQLGRDGDLAQAAVGGVQQLLHQLRHRILQALRVMGALAGERQERPLQMRAQHIRTAIHRGAHVAQVLAHHVDRVGDQRAHLPRRAVYGVAGPGDVDAFRAVVEGPLPRAVRVDVHVPRGQQTAGGVDDPRIIGRIDGDGAAGVFELLLVGAGGRDDPVGRGQPEMLPYAAGVDLPRAADGDAGGGPGDGRGDPLDGFHPVGIHDHSFAVLGLGAGLRCPARPACGRRRTRSSPCGSAYWPPPRPR